MDDKPSVSGRIKRLAIRTNCKREGNLDGRLEQIDSLQALITLKDRERLIADGDIAGANQPAVALRAWE